MPAMTYLTKTENDLHKVQQNLDKIETSSKFLLGLINDILDMSKAESGNIELHMEPYPPQEFASYMASKDYLYTAANIRYEWMILILMALLFAAIGTVFLEFIDKDSR